MFEYLPVEVMVEILKRLPVKSLVRCRSVCKTWSSLITNPSFISTHLQTALSKPHTHLLLRRFFQKNQENYALHFYNNDFHEFNQLPFPAKRCLRPFIVVGSCNGLVSLRSLGLGISNLILWNPSIHKYITLPNPSINCMNHNAYFIYGFGFDSRINDYKLVTLVVEKKKTLREAFLFSLNENSWKRVTIRSPKYAVHDIKSSTFVNGASHWMGYERGDDGKYRNTILGFDMSTEEILALGLPGSFTDSFPMDLSSSIMKYEESSIALLIRDWRRGNEVWIMKEYGVVGSWTKVLHFTQHSGKLPVVLGFRKNAQVLLEVDGGEMASLDLKSQQMEHLGIQAKLSFVDSYVESLVLLDKALDTHGE